MAQCPYCNNPIQDGTRFCLSCGRQLDIGITEEIKSGGISDLKKCFGSFPIREIDCYLCADEQKCASFSASKKQDEILSKLERIDDLGDILSKIKVTLEKMSTYLDAIDKNIVYIARNCLKR